MIIRPGMILLLQTAYLETKTVQKLSLYCTIFNVTSRIRYCTEVNMTSCFPATVHCFGFGQDRRLLINSLGFNLCNSAFGLPYNNKLIDSWSFYEAIRKINRKMPFASARKGLTSRTCDAINKRKLQGAPKIQLF